MSDEQLRELAKSMGIKRVDSIQHDDLVFQVLDHQAEAEAANAPEPTTKRRRERIRQPAAKANGNEVIKDDAVAPKNQSKEKNDIVETNEVTNTVEKEASEPTEKPKEQPKAQKKDKNKEVSDAQEPPKRKRGRPSAAV